MALTRAAYRQRGGMTGSREVELVTTDDTSSAHCTARPSPPSSRHLPALYISPVTYTNLYPRPVVACHTYLLPPHSHLPTLLPPLQLSLSPASNASSFKQTQTIVDSPELNTFEVRAASTRPHLCPSYLWRPFQSIAKAPPACLRKTSYPHNLTPWLSSPPFPRP
jgi:hypothetical protein